MANVHIKKIKPQKEESKKQTLSSGCKPVNCIPSN